MTPFFRLFVDGLDEFHGDHLELVRMLKQISQSKRFKICVSSRPWNVFEDELGQDESKRLYMHQLTRLDIQHYSVH